MIELLVLIGQFTATAYFQNSLALRLEKGNEGLFAVSLLVLTRRSPKRRGDIAGQRLAWIDMANRSRVSRFNHLINGK